MGEVPGFSKIHRFNPKWAVGFSRISGNPGRIVRTPSTEFHLCRRTNRPGIVTESAPGYMTFQQDPILPSTKETYGAWTEVELATQPRLKGWKRA